MRPFDVVLVPFPFVDGPEFKVRPAIIVSSPALVQTVGVYWMVMITSTQSPEAPGDHAIGDLAASGLVRPCRARTAKMFSLDEGLVVRRLGALAVEDARAVAARVQSWLAEAA